MISNYYFEGYDNDGNDLTFNSLSYYKLIKTHWQLLCSHEFLSNIEQKYYHDIEGINALILYDFGSFSYFFIACFK